MTRPGAGTLRFDRYDEALKLAAFVPYSGRIMVGAFLSHSSKDKPFVRDVAAALEAGGEIKVWLNEREIDYGQNIMLKIVDGLDADFVLLILSPDSVDSKWVKEK
jgi:TIR domain